MARFQFENMGPGMSLSRPSVIVLLVVASCTAAVLCADVPPGGNGYWPPVLVHLSAAIADAASVLVASIPACGLHFQHVVHFLCLHVACLFQNYVGKAGFALSQPPPLNCCSVDLTAARWSRTTGLGASLRSIVGGPWPLCTGTAHDDPAVDPTRVAGDEQQVVVLPPGLVYACTAWVLLTAACGFYLVAVRRAKRVQAHRQSSAAKSGGGLLAELQRDLTDLGIATGRILDDHKRLARAHALSALCFDVRLDRAVQDLDRIDRSLQDLDRHLERHRHHSRPSRHLSVSRPLGPVPASNAATGASVFSSPFAYYSRLTSLGDSYGYGTGQQHQQQPCQTTTTGGDEGITRPPGSPRGPQSPPTIIRTQDGEFNVSTHEGLRRWTEAVRRAKPAPTTLRVDRVDRVDRVNMARSSSGTRGIPSGIPSGPASMRTTVSRAPLSLQMVRDLCAEPAPEPEPEPEREFVPPAKHETEPAGPRAAVAAVAAARSDPGSNHPGTARRRNVNDDDEDDPTGHSYTNENASSSAGAPVALNAPDAPGAPDASCPPPPPTIEYLQQRLADAVEHGYRRVFVAGRGWMSLRRLECECMNLASCSSSDGDDTSVASTPDVPIGLIPLDKRTLAEKHAERATQAGHNEHAQRYTDRYTEQAVDGSASRASDVAQPSRDYDAHPGRSTTHATGIVC